MAKYTTELRSILEKSNIDLGMSNYPLYTFKNYIPTNLGKNLKGENITSFRDYLNNLIFKHYYFREIGVETPYRFVFMLNRKMDEIMPYYNQMLESTDIIFNPLWNVDLTETFTHEVNDNGNSTSNTTGNETINTDTTENGSNHRTETLEQISDNTNNSTGTRTPNIINDGIQANMDTAQDVLTNEQIKAHQYLSSATHNQNAETGTETNVTSNTENLKTNNDNSITDTKENSITGNQTNSSTNDNTIENTNTRNETYTRKQEGSSAGYLFTQNIEQWRKIMLNIPMLIIDELEQLFMQIF